MELASRDVAAERLLNRSRVRPGRRRPTNDSCPGCHSPRVRPSFRRLTPLQTSDRYSDCSCDAVAAGRSTPSGSIDIRRTEVRPFTDKQIALLKTFADQAVIAIENVRLFKELQERNRELREALEQQTATSEVLEHHQPLADDVQPVLDAIVESAARVCGIDDVVLRLRDGDISLPRAHFWPGTLPIGTRRDQSLMNHSIRWMREHGTLHIPDVRRARTISRLLGRCRWHVSDTACGSPCVSRENSLERWDARRTRCAPSPRRRSSSSKPSPTKR